jgi:hypothetical protein
MKIKNQISIEELLESLPIPATKSNVKSKKVILSPKEGAIFTFEKEKMDIPNLLCLDLKQFQEGELVGS